MSSFDKYNKKLQKKYGVETNEKEEEKTSGANVTTPSTSTTKKSSFQSYNEKLGKKYGTTTFVDTDYINSFVKDAQAYLNSAQSDYEKVWGSDGTSVYSETQSKWKDLQNRRFKIETYLETNKNYITEESYDSLKKFLDDFGKASSQMSYSFYDANRAMQTVGDNGWKFFLDDIEKRKAKIEAEKKAEAEKPWWEKVAEFFAAGATDTSIPLSGMPSIINDMSKTSPLEAQINALQSYAKSDWTEEQRNLFGYLYIKDPYAAADYARSIELEKAEEAATQDFWSSALHTAGSIVTAPIFGMADLLQDIAEYNARGELTIDPVSPYEYFQAGTGAIATDLNKDFGVLDESIPVIGGKGWGDVYGLGTSMAQSALAAHTGGGLQATVTFFGSAAASGVDDALSRGATDDQAMIYGVMAGVAEAAAEYLPAEMLLGNAGKGFFSSLLKQAGAEGLEEFATSLANNITDDVVMGDNSNFNLLVKAYMQDGMSQEEATKKAWIDTFEGMAFDALAGALSGGINSSLVSGAVYTYDRFLNKENTKAVNTYGEVTKDLVSEGLEIGDKGAKNLANKLQKKLNNGKDLSGYEIRKMVDANERSMESNDVATIKAKTAERLTELGETGDVAKLADIIVKHRLGESLSLSERAILNKSQYGRRVSNELNPENIKAGTHSSAWTDSIKTDRINTDAYGIWSKMSSANVVNADPDRESVIKSEFKASDSGKTVYNGEEVSVQKIASTEGGLMVELDNGQTVSAKEVEFSSDEEAMMYEMVTRMEVTPETAQAILEVAKPSATMSAESLFADVPAAYRYGKINYEAGLAKLSIPDAVKRIAYNLGRLDAITSTKEAKAPSTKKQTGKKATDKKGATTAQKGKVIFEGFEYNEDSATDMQKASMAGIDFLTKVSSLEIHVYESKVENGKRVAYIDGKKRLAPNGYFKVGTNKIYIDINAGNKGEGVMLHTTGHEIGHYIAENNWKAFKKIGDFLIENFGKNGVPVDQLISDKMEVVANSYKMDGRAVPSDSQLFKEAYEEVVCDSLSTMLADPRAYEKLAEFKKQDRNAWEILKDAIKKILDKIKSLLGVYSNVKPDAKEADYVSKFSRDVYEQLQDLYLKAFVEADENYQANNFVSIDTASESVSPKFSERTWTASEYVTEREEAAKKISQALGVDIKVAYKYIDDINGVAKLIADDRARLDYEPNLDEKASVLKPNSEYRFSVDMSTLCAKRLLFTGTFDAIQKALPNTVFDSEDIVSLREMMQKRGYEVACGICYVESTRREIGRITQEFIDRYKVAQETGKPISRINSSGKEVVLKSAGKTFSADKNYTPNLGELNTTDIDIVKRDHREVYDAYLAFMNARGQAKPKLLETRAEYKGEILKHFKAKSAVEARNNAGGLRLQSFSDFEVPHMIDMMQIVMDMSRVGLKSQAYTKVPAFAEVFGDSGVKINLSLIAKGDGLDSNGNLVFDDVEGINHKEAFNLRDKYSKNVGTILVGKTYAHIIAAMADPRIDYIIPFHKSSWKESLYDALGLTGYADYTDFQNEKPIDKDRKISNFDPSEYWDFSKSGDENAQIYLEKCREDGRIPKFPQFQGYPGYWKLLIDFKMYDNDGVGSPQEVVRPVFNTEASERILGEYKGGHKSFPVAKDVVEDFVKEHQGKANSYSERSAAGMNNKDRVAGNAFANFIDAVANMLDRSKMTKRKLKIGTISDAHAGMIESLMKTIDPTFSANGYELWIDGTGAEHINRRHGENGQADSSMATREARELVPWVANNPDAGDFIRHEDGSLYLSNRYFNADGSKAPQIRLEKLVDGDTIYVSECVPDSINKRVYITSAYKKSSTNQLLNMDSDESPQLTPEASFDSGATNGSISQDSDSVKRKFSERSTYAPTFYSYMGKVVDGIKSEKVGANGVVSYLKGKGVKAEEIKWSGIEAFLEGKKSVTKKELQEFVLGSQLRIEEEISGYNQEAYAELDALWKQHAGVSLAETFSDDFDLPLTEDNVADVFDDMERDGYDVPSIEDQRRMLELAKKAGNEGRWSRYKLGGGTNYRELVFKMPNSSYSNDAMRGHWGQDAEGVLAHARIQDMTTSDGKKMLFVEEIQSDWHNEGAKDGYQDSETESKIKRLKEEADIAFYELEDYSTELTGMAGEYEAVAKTQKGRELLRNHFRTRDALKDAENAYVKKVPDAPFRSTYHEYVLKRLLRMAAEEGYDSIGWTTADIQSKRWSEDYAEGYRIEYDQDIPKFLRKYGKRWGATVSNSFVNPDKGSTEMIELFEKDIEKNQKEIERIGDDESQAEWLTFLKDGIESMQRRIEKAKGTKVWSMDVTDSMKDSVLNEGQVMYSERVTDKETLDFLNGQIKRGEYITVYRSFQVIDGGLYAPMNAVDRDENGKNRKLGYRSELGKWEKATESRAIAQRYMDAHPDATYAKFDLDGRDNKTNGVAYNPYLHASNLVLNDQFSAAYRRNLVTVECRVPLSEADGAYKADYAKDATGWAEWKAGVVAGDLKKAKPDLDRRLFLSRYMLPVRILSDSEVATMYKDYLDGTDIPVPWNVVTPSLRKELEKAGVNISYKDVKRSNGLLKFEDQFPGEASKVRFQERNPDSVSHRSLLANALDSTAQNDVERNKLAQYKSKIALIESEQAKLADIRAKLKDLYFAKGTKDTKAINKLQFEANQIANRINTYDRQLLNLESTTALKGVLEREKQMAYKKAEQRGKDALKRQRERESATYKKLLAEHQESRKKAIESRHKTEMRHKIKKVVGDLNNLLLNPTKDKHVPIGLQLVVADALDAINMDTMNAEERVAYYNDRIAKSSNPDEIEMLTKKRDFFEYRDMNFKDKVTALKNAYAEFKNSDDPLIRNAHDDAIANLIENTSDMVGKKSLKDMSYEQLEAVYNMYKAILATVRNANKMFKEGRQESITENSEAVKTEVKEAGGHRDRVLKATKFLKKFGWDMLKPVTAMKVIGSDTLASLFDNVRAGEDTWAVDVSEAKAFYEDVSAKYGYKKWDFKKQYSFKDGMGNGFSLSLEQIMSLYAYSKREQADLHLERGGFIFDDAIEVTEKTKIGIPMKYEVNDANPYRLRKEDLAIVVEALSADQKGFVDEMQRYLSEVMGEKGNEVSLAMYDIKLYNEKNYFPLKTSRYFREFDPEKSATPKVKNAGFSKKTVPQAGNPIVLSNFMDVWASHVNDMSMYHAFVLPLEDFTRVYNYSSTAGGYDSVQQYIKNAYGAQANQYIEKLLDDLNGGARVDSSAGVINKGLSLFKKASVFASASVVIQQPSAIGRALAYINPKYFVAATGSALNIAKHKELWAEVKKYAPVAIIKEMGYFDTGIGRSSVDWIKGNQTIKDKVDDVLSKAPAIADELTWTHIWEAVKREVKATTNLKEGSEEFLKKAGARFTEVIVNTQVYDSVLSRSGMMRSKDTGMKMATAFMAEPTTTANMMIDGIIQGKRGNKKFLAATVGGVSASIVLNSILVALVYAARDDDEDETYIEKYLGSLTSELLDGFNPLTYIPFVKDIWSIAQGYDVERSDMTVVSNLWEAIERIFSDKTSGWDKVADVTGAVSSLFGIPLKNIIRDAKGLYNLTKTFTSGTQTTGAGIAESVEDAFTSSIPLWDRLNESKTNADRLYEAIMSGDQAQIDRIKGRFKDDDAVATAIRKALRDNDPRIKEAAQARYNGNISEYTRIAKEIISEGKFSQDLVVGAINAEVNAIKKDNPVETEETEDKKDEVTSIYAGSDLNAAFDNGDNSLALKIIDDLIETKVANGMEGDKAKSSVRSSMTSYWKPLYKQAWKNGDVTEMARIRQILRASGLYGTSTNDIVKAVKAWLKD